MHYHAICLLPCSLNSCHKSLICFVVLGSYSLNVLRHRWANLANDDVLYLKSVSATPARSPLWLKKACRSLIWKTVSKSEGVLAVFSGILQNGNY